MSTWYRVNGFRWGTCEIEPIEILKSTSGSVYVDGRRQAKSSEYTRFFETRDEAIDFLRERYSARLENAESDAIMYSKALEELK